jgi:hypothetical protein
MKGAKRLSSKNDFKDFDFTYRIYYILERFNLTLNLKRSPTNGHVPYVAAKDMAADTFALGGEKGRVA